MTVHRPAGPPPDLVTRLKAIGSPAFAVLARRAVAMSEREQVAIRKAVEHFDLLHLGYRIKTEPDRDWRHELQSVRVLLDLIEQVRA